EAKSGRNGDRVDEDGLVAVEPGWITEAIAHCSVVGVAVDLVVPERRIGPADKDGEVAALGPCTRSDAVAGPTFDGKVARLQIDEERGGWVQRPQQTGLADAGLAEDRTLDAARLGEPLIGRDDGEGHFIPPRPG